MRPRTGPDTFILQLTVSAVLIVLTVSLMGCTDATEPEKPQSGGSMTPAQIDPTAPADKASDTVDDANAVTDDRSSEVDELTDSD